MNQKNTSKGKYWILIWLGFCISQVLNAQDFDIPPIYFRYLFNKSQSKLMLSNNETNLVLNLKTGSIDSILHKARVLPYRQDDEHLIFEGRKGKGVANWEGEILVSPKYSNLYNASGNGGGFSGLLGNKVYVIPSYNYNEIKTNYKWDQFISSYRDTLVLTGKPLFEGGSLLLNIDGDTIFNFTEKMQIDFIPDFPNLFTTKPVIYQPGIGIMHFDGTIIIPHDKKNKEFKKIGNYLQIITTDKKDYYLNQEGEILSSIKNPIFLKSFKDWSIYTNCIQGEIKHSTLKKNEQTIIPCSDQNIEFLKDIDLISIRSQRQINYSDLDGNIIINGSNLKVCYYIGMGYFLTSKDKVNYQILNSKGEKVIKIEGEIFGGRNGVKIIQIKGKDFFLITQKKDYILLDNQGKLVFSKKHNAFKRSFEMTYRHGHFFFALGKNKFDLLDSNGYLIPAFSNVEVKLHSSPKNSKYFITRKNNTSSWSLINLEDFSEILTNKKDIVFLTKEYVLTRDSNRFYDIIKVPK